MEYGLDKDTRCAYRNSDKYIYISALTLGRQGVLDGGASFSVILTPLVRVSSDTGLATLPTGAGDELMSLYTGIDVSFFVGEVYVSKDRFHRDHLWEPRLKLTPAMAGILCISAPL